MSKKPGREEDTGVDDDGEDDDGRVSPQESVEGPDVKARPERTSDLDDKDSSPSQRQRRPRPSFRPGADLARRIFKRHER